MKKILKPLAYVIVLIVLVIIGVIAYVVLALPNVGPPENIKVELTPQRIARGKYLAMNVVQCVDCHSKRDWTKLGGPIDTTTLGGGGELFDEAGAGFPGEVYVPNITPYKLANWTDGELFRAITTGQRKNGDAIFPLMPWPYYSKLDREDIYDVIAYIRSLKPIKADYPKSKLDFPLNIIVHTMPKKAELGTKPDPKDTLKFGAYMAQASACMECHSQDDKGTLLPGLEFAGGRPFKLNGGTVKSANITPDKETGIGNWTKEMFIAKFKSFNDRKSAPSVKSGEFQTIMPWWGYAGMGDNELGAIYTYLRTLKPIKNSVIKFSVK
jgi:mono/diheme cytochrome c family protein